MKAKGGSSKSNLIPRREIVRSWRREDGGTEGEGGRERREGGKGRHRHSFFARFTAIKATYSIAHDPRHRYGVFLPKRVSGVKSRVYRGKRVRGVCKAG